MEQLCGKLYGEILHISLSVEEKGFHGDRHMVGVYLFHATTTEVRPVSCLIFGQLNYTLFLTINVIAGLFLCPFSLQICFKLLKFGINFWSSMLEANMLFTSNVINRLIDRFFEKYIS